MQYAQRDQTSGKAHLSDMKKAILDPLFLFGLALKLSLILCILPTFVQQWYDPFLESSISVFQLNPWSSWIDGGGDFRAFPYGYVMWFAFLPLSLLTKCVGLSISVAYGLTLLITDFALFRLFENLFPGRSRLLILAYWLSPITIVASYVLGFNDLIPVTLLVLAMYFLKRNYFVYSGIATIAAISAKLSMVIALPFFLIYFLHNKTFLPYLYKYLQGAATAFLIVVCPFLASTAGMQMILSNPEAAKIYELFIPLGGVNRLYLTPLAYLLMVYAAWRVKRLNFELFYVLLGVAFLVVVIMTPASLGWYIWAIPIFIAFQFLSDRIALFLVGVFSLLFLIESVIQLRPDLLGVNFSIDHFQSLIQTAEIAIGLVLIARIWRESISRNDFFRLSQKPFVIGIAGDSGAGKDTFANALQGLFGGHSVAMISGDDYHLWDRQKPMWQVMTHLNPRANDLEGFAADLITLSDGKKIQSRHYDHKTGRKGKKFSLRSNDIIIASGLHALYLKILRDCYDLTVYLDMDEDLRRYLKIRRDVHERGHILSAVLNTFDKREADSIQFIRTQSGHADLVFSVRPIHASLQNWVETENIGLKLVTRSRHGFSEASLQRLLIGICGLHVDMASDSDGSVVEMTIEGEVSAEDIKVAALIAYPQLFEFLDIIPKWQGGVLGLMQFITLSHINQALKKRIL